MSQRRLKSNVVNFPGYAPPSRLTQLHSIRPSMLRATSSRSLPFGSKAEELKRRRPDVAAVVERLVDDLLAERVT